MKIVSLNKGNWGKKRVIAFDGEVQIGEDGVADVSQKAADHLVKNGTDWAYEGREAEKLPPPFPDADQPNQDDEIAALKRKIAELEAGSPNVVEVAEKVEEVEEVVIPEPTQVANVAGQDDSEQSEESKKSEKADQMKQAREILESKKKGELQELCAKKDFPKEEWEDLLKADLVEYLMGKV